MVMGGCFMTNKMELTLDKNCVGKAGGTGCVSECLREVGAPWWARGQRRVESALPKPGEATLLASV